MLATDGWPESRAWADTRAKQREAALAAARRAATVEAYRREWSEAGIAVDSPEDIGEGVWTRLPLLTKDRLVEAAARSGPFGDRLGVPRGELAHVFVAPGPIYMPFTRADLDHVATSFARALSACGIAPGDLVDQTTMYNWVIAATAIDRALAILGCGVVPGGVGQTERHVEAIGDLRCDAIVAFPTFLERLFARAAALGTRLPLRKAVVMGELSHPDAKARLLSEHAIVAREFYGTADVGAVAWECEAGHGMHLRSDLLVEFLAPGTPDPAEPAPGRPAEIVATDFHRRAMPIIRLRTGDLVDELLDGPCPCGRTAPRFRRIVGRASEITKVKGMFVVPRQVVDVMQRVGLARPFQLVVDRPDGQGDRLLLAVAGEAPADADAFKAEVERALRIKVDVTFGARLPDGAPRLDDRRPAGWA